MYDSLSSPGSILNEQTARQVFDILPQPDWLMVIIGSDGSCWPSDSNAFQNFDTDVIKQLCSRIDDGEEPVIRQIGRYAVIITDLAAEQVKCGYVMIALQRYDMEWLIDNTEIFEFILDQVNLITRLIEKNNHLYELQLKMSSGTAREQVN
ncbi:MAG: hypothetical protein ABIG61_10165 [Planctomycetota bacterium]